MRDEQRRIAEKDTSKIQNYLGYNVLKNTNTKIEAGCRQNPVRLEGDYFDKRFGSFGRMQKNNAEGTAESGRRI